MVRQRDNTMSREQLRIELDWFCGCGNPGAAARALLAVLDMHPLHDEQNNKDFWQGLFGADGGMGWLVLYFIDHLELTEHGGNVGGGWLTPKGEAVRDALQREKALDDFDSLMEPDVCIHGIDVEDDSHDCMKAPEPVKWGREGPKA